jgi:predicted Fe-Mo cluster-binding NifX family protein
MKIAVAALDAATVSQHFGRSACFIVFDVKDGRITGKEVRDNTFTPHAKGECDGEHDHQHDQPHSHAGILNALRGCDVVLCRGMGWRAAEDLKAHGIKPFITALDATPDEIANAYVAGKLKASEDACRCHE